MNKTAISIRLLSFVIILSVASLAFAGDMNAPAGPADAGSAMFTLADLYNRLNTGAQGTKRSGPFAEPSAAPGSTMHSLNDIMNKAPVVDNTAGAGVEHVLAGKTYWGLQSGKWGLQTGTLANVGAMNITPSAATQTITAGFHDGAGKVGGDANLVAEKIVDGVAIFGVAGTAKVATGTAVAAEVLTGKTFSNTGAVNVSGTMANVGAMNITPSTATQTITAGFHDGAGKVGGDANLVAEKIVDGAAIFGVAGTAKVATGTAVAAEVLTGKTFSNTGAVNVSGTMANVGAQNITPSAATQTITAGFHDGAGKVGGDADLVAGNIRAGVNLFGVDGTSAVVNTTSANATAGELLFNRTAWVNGQEITGTLANVGTMNITPSAATQTITAGFHDGTGKVAGDADLVTGNIRAGVNLFGVNGNAAVVNTSSGNATAGELLYTRTAWVNGQEITGTHLGGIILKAGGSFSTAKRWYDNADGTITDVTTGLVWLKNVSVSDRTFTATATDQIDCFRFCGELQNGTNGLTDGSRLNDWRPPTIREMQSLRTGPEAIGNGNFQGFSATASYTYWTVSSDNLEPGKSVTINMTTGVLEPKFRVSFGGDSIRGFIWPVRNAFMP